MSSMHFAPVMTLPRAMAERIMARLRDYFDPAWGDLAQEMGHQLHDGPVVTFALPWNDLVDLYGQVLDLAIDLGDGTLAPQVCGFTYGQTQAVIYNHLHLLPCDRCWGAQR